MSGHAHPPAHAHHHGYDHRGAGLLPLSAMAQSALVRVGAVALVLGVLWLAVLWAIALP